MGQHEPHAPRIGERLAEDESLAPGPALDQRGRQDDGAQRATAPLATSEQAVDQQLERALELRARRRLGQLERLLESTRPRHARAQRRVTPAGEVASAQAGRAEAVGDRRARQRRELARACAIPTRSSGVTQRVQRRGSPAMREQRDRQRRRGSRAQRRRADDRHDLGSAHARPRGRGERREARRRGADAGRERGRRGARRCSVCSSAAVQVAQRLRVEPDERRAGRSRPQRPIASRRASSASCASATPAGSGATSCRSGQRASASPSRMPARTPHASAAADGSPIDRLAARLGRQRRRPAEQPLPSPGGDGELEAGKLETGDHTNTCSHSERRDGQVAVSLPSRNASPVSARVTRRSRYSLLPAAARARTIRGRDHPAARPERPRRPHRRHLRRGLAAPLRPDEPASSTSAASRAMLNGPAPSRERRAPA